MGNLILFITICLHVFSTTSLVLFLDKKVKRLEQKCSDLSEITHSLQNEFICLDCVVNSCSEVDK